ncbi:MAG: RNA polymerase sigma factor [Muribaculaceae bacterium]|nr:RNA polymerase sigma factor [Muribaculaceae bacterium]
MKSVNLYMPVMVVAEYVSMPSLTRRRSWLQELWPYVGWWLRGMWMSLSVALGDVEKTRELQRQFEALIATHSTLISRICFSYAADSEDYNDLRQDVLINIWKGIATFRGDASSLTWVYRVTLNTCVSTVRKRSRRPATERLDTMPFDIPEEKEDEGLRERFETLHRLISELSPIDKAIVTMWLDERSYDEIAEVVGMSKNNIGLRLHRIRERWRKQSKIS